jgi:hypothetical protein
MPAKRPTLHPVLFSHTQNTVLQVTTISKGEKRFEITKSKHTMNLIFL